MQAAAKSGCSGVCSAFICRTDPPTRGGHFLESHGLGWSLCDSSSPTPIFLFLSFCFSVLENTLSHKAKNCPVSQENNSSPQGLASEFPVTNNVFSCDTKTQQNPVCPVISVLWEGVSYSSREWQLSLGARKTLAK